MGRGSELTRWITEPTITWELGTSLVVVLEDSLNRPQHLLVRARGVLRVTGQARLQHLLQSAKARVGTGQRGFFRVAPVTLQHQPACARVAHGGGLGWPRLWHLLVHLRVGAGAELARPPTH